MKNTESGPPRSSGPLTHVNSAPVSVPCLETVVSLCTAYSPRKPQNQLSPHPQVPFASSSSRTLGVQTAGGCQGDLSRGLQASVRDFCSWTKRGQHRPPQVVRELPDKPGTYLPLLRLRVTTPLSLSEVSESCSVVSNSLRSHGLYSLWNSPGQNIGVRGLSLLQGIFPTQGWNPGLWHCRQILYLLSHKGCTEAWIM